MDDYFVSCLVDPHQIETGFQMDSGRTNLNAVTIFLNTRSGIDRNFCLFANLDMKRMTFRPDTTGRGGYRKIRGRDAKTDFKSIVHSPFICMERIGITAQINLFVFIFVKQTDLLPNLILHFFECIDSCLPDIKANRYGARS